MRRDNDDDKKTNNRGGIEIGIVETRVTDRRGERRPVEQIGEGFKRRRRREKEQNDEE